MRRAGWFWKGAASKGAAAAKLAARTGAAVTVTAAKVAFCVATCPVRACCRRGRSDDDAPDAAAVVDDGNGAEDAAPALVALAPASAPSTVNASQLLQAAMAAPVPITFSTAFLQGPRSHIIAVESDISALDPLPPKPLEARRDAARSEIATHDLAPSEEEIRTTVQAPSTKVLLKVVQMTSETEAHSQQHIDRAVQAAPLTTLPLTPEHVPADIDSVTPSPQYSPAPGGNGDDGLLLLLPALPSPPGGQVTSPTKEKAQVGDALGCITDTTANVSGGRVIVPDVDDNETSSVASRSDVLTCGGPFDVVDAVQKQGRRSPAIARSSISPAKQSAPASRKRAYVSACQEVAARELSPCKVPRLALEMSPAGGDRASSTPLDPRVPLAQGVSVTDGFADGAPASPFKWTSPSRCAMGDITNLVKEPAAASSDFFDATKLSVPDRELQATEALLGEFSDDDLQLAIYLSLQDSGSAVPAGLSATGHRGAVPEPEPASSEGHSDQHYFTILPIEPDGRCCYRSLVQAHCLLQTGTFMDTETSLISARLLQQELCDLMEDYGYSYLFEDFLGGEELIAYTTRQREDRAWGGEHELRAAAILFNADIKVYKRIVEGGPAVLWQRYLPLDEDFGGRPGAANMSLLFGGGDGVTKCVHYDVIIPAELETSLSCSGKTGLFRVRMSSYLREGLA